MRTTASTFAVQPVCVAHEWLVRLEQNGTVPPAQPTVRLAGFSGQLCGTGPDGLIPLKLRWLEFAFSILHHLSLHTYASCTPVPHFNADFEESFTQIPRSCKPK